MGGAVPVTSIRIGHVPGEHEVIFDGPFEQLRVHHVVRDRRVFADGALAAAQWLAGRHGVFTMDDMLRDGPGTGPARLGGRPSDGAADGLRDGAVDAFRCQWRHRRDGTAPIRRVADHRGHRLSGALRDDRRSGDDVGA